MADTRASDKISAEIDAAKALRASLGADADDAELLANMIEGETSLYEMVGLVLNVIDREQELLDGISAREQDLKDRKERIRYRQAGLKAKIEQALLIFGERRMELPEATLSLSRRPSKLIIADESQVPSQFWKRGDPVLDRAGLTAHMKGLSASDAPVPGCILEPAPDTLTIRRK